MKNFNFFFIYLILLVEYISNDKTYPKITKEDKAKVNACISLQQKKFQENEELINNFVKKYSYIYTNSPNKIILLAMAYCYDKIPIDIANAINKWNIRSLNVTRLGIEDIYNFENYNYSDAELNKKTYSRFIPIFEVVYNEISGKDNNNNINKFDVYFTHTFLFKFFVAYTLINIIIIFKNRIINRSKFVDTTVELKEEDLNEKTEEKENKDSTDNRKLKKKNKLGKVKTS